MRIATTITMLAFFSTLTFADEKPTHLAELKAPTKLESLQTKGGKTYNKVTIREKTPSGIKIFHEAGATTIRFEDLSQELQEALGGFNPEAAKKYRTQSNKEQKSFEKSQAKASLQRRKKKMSADREKRIDGVKVPARVVIKQMLDEGALCIVSMKTKRKVQHKTPRPLGGYDIKVTEKWAWTSYTKEWYYVKGLPTNLVDGSSWGGWLLPSGSYVYTSTQGARKTVRQLTVVSPPKKR